MRIIAGQWRGRTIAVPKGDNTRPILDRAKTVLFDMLGYRLALPGRLPPLAVLDLFAGSGTLALEALSRGARYALCVERHRATARLLRQNLDTLGAVDAADIIDADATRCEFPPPPDVQAGHHVEQPPVYELVFIDPPFRLLSRPKPDRTICELLHRLALHPVIAPSALIVVRHPFRPADPPDLAPLIELDRRNVGRSTLRFMTTPRDQGDIDETNTPTPTHDELDTDSRMSP